MKKMVLSSQRQGNVTSVAALPRKPLLDKKAVLKSKIQDILRGRQRFVIRKEPAAGSTGRTDSSGGEKQEQENQNTQSPPSVSRTKEEVKRDRCCLSYLFYKCSKWRSVSVCINSVKEQVSNCFCVQV